MLLSKIPGKLVEKLFLFFYNDVKSNWSISSKEVIKVQFNKILKYCHATSPRDKIDRF